MAEIFEDDKKVQPAVDNEIVVNNNDPAVEQSGRQAEDNNDSAAHGVGADDSGKPDPYDPAPYKLEAVKGLDSQLEALRKEASEVEEETPEQKKKRERSEKAQRIMGAVADGLSSIANLYFTTKYAPSMYKKENSMQQKQNATFERLKAEREANREKALAFAIKIGEKEAERANLLRDIEEEMERRRQAQQMHTANLQLRNEEERRAKQLANKAESDAHSSQVAADYAEQQQQADLNLKKAKKNTEGSRQRANNAAARAHDRSNQEYDEEVSTRKEKSSNGNITATETVKRRRRANGLKQKKGKNTRNLGL